MPRWSQLYLARQIQPLLRSNCLRPAAVILAMLFLVPMVAMAQGSPFDTGFNAIQSLFTGTIAKVASLVAIVIGGYGFAHGEPGAKKALAGVAALMAVALGVMLVAGVVWFAHHHHGVSRSLQIATGQQPAGDARISGQTGSSRTSAETVQADVTPTQDAPNLESASSASNDDKIAQAMEDYDLAANFDLLSEIPKGERRLAN